MKKDAEVTAKRRELILQAVDYCCTLNQGWTSVKLVNDTLLLWIEQGLAWPQAQWVGAVRVPYYTGTCQHLVAMAGPEGVLERGSGGYRIKAAAAGGLRRRAIEVLRLKSEGKTLEAIAEELGISTSLAGSLATDPTGAGERERKRRYCPGCGTKKPQAASCPACQEKQAADLLPPASFTVYLEQAEEEGVEMLFGVTPDFRRVIRCGTWRAYEEYEVRRDLSWLDGLREFQEQIGVNLV